MAVCPFCSAPLSTADILRGKLTNCPRCGKRLAQGAAVQPAPVAERSDALAPPTEAPAAAPPPRPHAAVKPARLPVRDPVDEEGSQLEEDASVPAELSTDLDHVPLPDDDEPASRPRLRVDGLTLGGLCAGSAGLLLASAAAPLALGSKPLSGLGLLLAGLGCVVAVVRGTTNLLLPLFVVALCLLDLVFMGEWPRAALGNPYAAPLALPLDARSKVERLALREEDWVDAEVFAIRDRDIRLQVVGARLDAVDDKNLEKPSGLKGKQLLIQVRASYEGTRYQQFQFDSWADQPGLPSKHPPILVDDKSRVLEQLALPPRKQPPGRKPGPSVLTPGRQVGDLLVYPLPPASAEYLHLELPAAAFQVKEQPPLSGQFRFKIPRSMIKES